MTALCKFEGRTEERELSFEYGDLIKITKIITKVIFSEMIKIDKI